MTSKQPTAVEENDFPPLHVVDPATNTSYVLVRADLFQKMTGGMEPFHPRDAYPFVERVMQDDDARDPLLASYQRISSERSS